MGKIHKYALGPIAVTLALGTNYAASQGESGAALTIYSTAHPGAIAPEVYRNGGRGQAIPGYAVVRQQRDLNLQRGRNTVRFADVAAFIDPTTVVFESLTDGAGTSVVEQSFQFDLVNQKKEPVTVIVKENLYRWVNWQITSSTHEFQKQDARTVHFPVTIAAGAELTLRYNVQYTW